MTTQDIINSLEHVRKCCNSQCARSQKASEVIEELKTFQKQQIEMLTQLAPATTFEEVVKEQMEIDNQ